MKEKLRFPVIVVYAKDWGSERGPVPWDHPPFTYNCWIAGLLIREDEETISIAQDYCPETEKCREIFTITKHSIIQRLIFPVDCENDLICIERR